jgi:hypothetical protein
MVEDVLTFFEALPVVYGHATGHFHFRACRPSKLLKLGRSRG